MVRWRRCALRLVTLGVLGVLAVKNPALGLTAVESLTTS
jgi:hypothetical protein